MRGGNGKNECRSADRKKRENLERRGKKSFSLALRRVRKLFFTSEGAEHTSISDDELGFIVRNEMEIIEKQTESEKLFETINVNLKSIFMFYLLFIPTTITTSFPSFSTFIHPVIPSS